MPDDDIDLDRVVIDPAYRREVVRRLKAAEAGAVGPQRQTDTAAPAGSGEPAHSRP